MRTHTVALVLSADRGSSVHVDTLCDDAEIQYLETALVSGEKDPLHQVYQQRESLEKQDIEFEDYVEALLSQPFLNPEVQQHGVQWFRSRIKIEHYKKSENEAAKVIAEYAFKIFQEEPSKTDFMLMSTKSQVRVRIFIIPAVPLAKVG